MEITFIGGPLDGVARRVSDTPLWIRVDLECSEIYPDDRLGDEKLPCYRLVEIDLVESELNGTKTKVYLYEPTLNSFRKTVGEQSGVL